MKIWSDPENEFGSVENVPRDILAAPLERERRTLKEIESALAWMEEGEWIWNVQ